jgi:hypothetical protein
MLTRKFQTEQPENPKKRVGVYINSQTMKTKQILNILVFLLAIIGVFFKMMHWPGAGIILTVTVLLILILLITHVSVENQGAGLSSFLNYFITDALAVFFLTFLFKVMHWPGAGILAGLSSLLVLIISGVLVFSKKEGNVSKEYVLMFFIFLFMLDGLLPNTGWRKVFHPLKQEDHKMVTAIAPTKMNVLYIGVDNPIAIAVSETDMNRIEVKTDNGEIVGEKGNYVMHPKNVNQLAKIIVLQNGRPIDSAIFRVKLVPDPVAKIAGIKGAGAIDQKILLEQKGIYAEMENFDFDLGFKVVEFKVSANTGGYSVDKISNNDQFTQEQFDLIKKVKKDNKIYIEDIKAQGPDGAIRQLGSIAITVK